MGGGSTYGKVATLGLGPLHFEEWQVMPVNGTQNTQSPGHPSKESGLYAKGLGS